MWPGLPGYLGMWAWLLHRVSGLALVFYLLLHIFVISSSIRGKGSFDEVLGALQTPVFVVLDLFLLLAAAFHALNGIRIVLFDLGVGVRRQKAFFLGAVACTALIFAAAAIRVAPRLL